MKILTSKQFENKPVGTVYCLWTPQMYTSNVKIKGTKRSADQSWWDLSLLPWGKDDLEQYALNTDIETEAYCTDEAIYNHSDNQLWCIFDKGEVEEMISRLQNALKGIVDQEE